MTSAKQWCIRFVGYVTLFGAIFLLALFIANVRARIYYHGPNYSFLFWIFLYSVVVGIGLLKLKRWAVASLFVPGIVFGSIVGYGMWKVGVPNPWVLLNVAFVAFFFAVPALLLRGWHS